jgi:hypothetical protein
LTAQITQFSPWQQEAALVVIERMAWGDMDHAIRDTETALRLAMDATRAEFLRWEEELGPAFEKEGIGDEFLVPGGAGRGDVERGQARLPRLRTVAISYGVDPGFGYLVPGESPLERYDRLEGANRSSPRCSAASSTSVRCPPPRARRGEARRP